MNPIIQKAKDLADFVDGGGLGDPVHPMIRAYLAEHFGGRLTFRGCHFTPTHAIQDNSPVENVIRMCQPAHWYGRY
ncbi:MAG TPA: hypothetical protein IAB51_03410 [Candidatus Merdivicinus excrementipullorum]|uniref:Uncharacterized protein n=1 Tax=Candidatus Merdivicinus excrementipullorum TaxID=2840867 RepID=A0A9D1FLA9_9FIRM|nr:hypothetical protein [Candidatus Merdivicinus excrementipullorum]